MFDEYNGAIEYRTPIGDGLALTCLSVGIAVPKDAHAPLAPTSWGGPRGVPIEAIFVDEMATWGRR